MIHRILFIIIAFWVSSFYVSGRSAADFFTSAPDAVIRLLPQATRLDMIDYFNYGSKRASENFFGGSARVTAVSENTVTFAVDDNVTMQLAILPVKNDTVIALITTVALPVEDSAVKFYGKDWKLLKNQPLILPDYNSWLTTEGLENIDELSANLPFMPVSAAFSDDALSITLYNNAFVFLGEKQQIPADKWIIPSKTYDIKSGQFILRK